MRKIVLGMVIALRCHGTYVGCYRVGSMPLRGRL